MVSLSKKEEQHKNNTSRNGNGKHNAHNNIPATYAPNGPSYPVRLARSPTVWRELCCRGGRWDHNPEVVFLQNAQPCPGDPPCSASDWKILHMHIWHPRAQILRSEFLEKCNSRTPSAMLNLQMNEIAYASPASPEAPNTPSHARQLLPHQERQIV